MFPPLQWNGRISRKSHAEPTGDVQVSCFYPSPDGVVPRHTPALEGDSGASVRQYLGMCSALLIADHDAVSSKLIAMFVCMYVCMCVYACMYVCMYVYMYVRTYVCGMYVCVCVCVYVCMCDADYSVE